jgi:hypothetical protein
MTALSDWAENALIAWLLDNAAAATRPTAWYVSLHTGSPGETGASNELSGNGYARQEVTGGFTISTNTATNGGLLTFGPNTSSNWGTVSHVGVWDAVSAGNCLVKGALTASKAATVGDSITIAAGELDIDLN